MKTILIATDFSKASRNASLYGVELAKALNAKIILFNAYEIPQPAPGFGVSISRYDIIMEEDKRLLDEAHFLDPKDGIIETICDEGLPEDAIINIANEKKADFIIAGMKGRGKTLKKIFGSTATSLIKRSDIPVIIIPEEVKFSIPEIILYASDMRSDTNIDHVYQIKPITETFKSKLYAVKVVKDEYEEIFERLHTTGKLRKELKKLDASFEYPIDTDIRHALNECIKKHHADMLIMIPHKHHWLERFYKKSQTKDMIFHIPIPILVIPETHLVKTIL